MSKPKKPGVHTLSRILPEGGELQRTFREIETQSDRGAALIASSFLENMLMVSLLTRMVVETSREALFESEGAPLGSFAAKVRIARGLGIIGDQTEANLAVIRKVRNQFAHAVIALDFRHPLIAAECEKLPLLHPADWLPEHAPMRRRFASTCIGISEALFTAADARAGAPIVIDVP